MPDSHSSRRARRTCDCIWRCGERPLIGAVETLLYPAAAVATIAILMKLALPATSVIGLVAAAIALVAVLATARHGPQALVDVLDALARLLR